MYVNDHTPSPYNEPVLAPDDHLSELPIEEILITAGSYEVLLDGIADYVTRLQVSMRMNPGLSMTIG
jgi:hypothetical protein